MSKTGLLLINLGTPDAPNVKAVRRYLKEFLLDPRVIDTPALIRYALVYGVIAPFRSRKSAESYQKIWTTQGSPLRVHSESLATAVADKLGADYQVALGMRYGNPSIKSAVSQLKECDKMIVLPLFPQYAEASTGSAIAKACDELSRQNCTQEIKIIKEFYDYPDFINAMADKIKPYLKDKETLLLLSYHGLPERQIDKIPCKAQCDRQSACPAINADNQSCYRAQCYATSRAIAQHLKLSEERVSTSFQSRLGRVPWIKPYTDEILVKLREDGVKKLVIACPAFVADCLETLEEIGMGIRENWLALGGESFELVPCLNADPNWVDAVIRLAIHRK